MPGVNTGPRTLLKPRMVVGSTPKAFARLAAESLRLTTTTTPGTGGRASVSPCLSGRRGVIRGAVAGDRGRHQEDRRVARIAVTAQRLPPGLGFPHPLQARKSGPP